MRGIGALLLAVGACYQPSPATGVPCASNGDCPGAQRCDTSQAVPTCVDSLPGEPDAAIAIDATSTNDAALEDGPRGARVIPPGAVLWLELDDDPSDGVRDSAAPARIVTCTAACPAVVSGRFGMAYRFAGAHRLETPDAPELRPGSAFTVAGWVSLDGTPSDLYATFACKVLTSTDASYCASVRQNGRPNYYTSTHNSSDTGATLAMGTWYHLAMTWDGATKRGYLDGVEYASHAISSIPANTGPFVVGTFQLNLYRVPGVVDDVVVYDRALSGVEVAQLAAP